MTRMEAIVPVPASGTLEWRQRANRSRRSRSGLKERAIISRVADLPCLSHCQRSIRGPSSTACRTCPGSIACSTRRAWRSTSARRATCASASASYFQKGVGPRTAAHAGARGGDRDDGDALGGRGAAAREQPHQVAGAALQHPVPRRQVLSVPEVHDPRVSAHGLLPRRRRPACAVLRPVSRMRGR